MLVEVKVNFGGKEKGCQEAAMMLPVQHKCALRKTAQRVVEADSFRLFHGLLNFVAVSWSFSAQFLKVFQLISIPLPLWRVGLTATFLRALTWYFSCLQNTLSSRINYQNFSARIAPVVLDALRRSKYHVLAM